MVNKEGVPHNTTACVSEVRQDHHMKVVAVFGGVGLWHQFNESCIFTRDTDNDT